MCIGLMKKSQSMTSPGRKLKLCRLPWWWRHRPGTWQADKEGLLGVEGQGVRLPSSHHAIWSRRHTLTGTTIAGPQAQPTRNTTRAASAKNAHHGISRIGSLRINYDTPSSTRSCVGQLATLPTLFTWACTVAIFITVYMPRGFEVRNYFAPSVSPWRNSQGSTRPGVKWRAFIASKFSRGSLTRGSANPTANTPLSYRTHPLQYFRPIVAHEGCIFRIGTKHVDPNFRIGVEFVSSTQLY
jgi:hypothetical protein